MREEITRLVHDVDSLLAIGNSHMYVQTKDQIGSGDLLHVFDNCRVALVHRDELVHPMRKRMRTGGSNLETVARRQFCQLPPKIDNLLPGNARVAANLCAELHHRLVHLGLDALLQNHFAAIQNLLDVRSQFACFRIDDLEFLLDAESEDMITSLHPSKFNCLLAATLIPNLALALQKYTHELSAFSKSLCKWRRDLTSIQEPPARLVNPRHRAVANPVVCDVI